MRRLYEASVRASCLAGPVAVVAAWAVIGLSWVLNRDWFVFTRDAFSDFGGASSCCPGLYNYGLMLVGALLVAFGSCIVLADRDRLGVLGGGYLALAGVFLALIGVFPSGTRPHTFVSFWFFVQADLGLVFLAARVAREWGSAASRLALAAAVLAFPLAGLVEALWGWPSAAVVEAYGVLVIDFVALVVFAFYWGRLRGQVR